MNHIGDILSSSSHAASHPPREQYSSTPHSSLPPYTQHQHADDSQTTPGQHIPETTRPYALDFEEPSTVQVPSPEALRERNLHHPHTSDSFEQHTASSLDIDKMKSMIFSMKDQLNALLRLLDGERVTLAIMGLHEKTQVLETGETVIEGVFNGIAMIGEDGHEYNVPENYASKSKMVEGDLLKLTITNKGSHIYKQIGPIDRKRVIGELVKDTASVDHWVVLAEGRTYKVIGASVTYYKGNAGDEVVLLVPRSGMSEWGAVDHVIKQIVHSS
ncbi:MAG: hypothetical protein GW939_02685 [Candidatus Magasanikbacteria bacterium]|nr:hypothetical protein [Candidatus Magasanikbacteria bacterium]NCS71677.1 hypothetical protein [Candidatus Magasanikbacteria bacterium]